MRDLASFLCVFALAMVTLVGCGPGNGGGGGAGGSGTAGAGGSVGNGGMGGMAGAGGAAGFGGMAGTGGAAGFGGMTGTGGAAGFGGMAGTGGTGGSGGAPECEVAEDCEPGGECTTTVCASGMCDTQTAPDGTSCDYSAPSDGTCTGGACGPTGCVPACVDLDEDDCTEPVCPEGATECSTQPVPEHSDCNEGGGSHCDTDGNCVQCTVPRHCNDNEECTDDACTVANMCVNAPKADGEPCSQGGCLGGVCGTVFPCTEQGIRDAIAAGGGPYTFDCNGPTTVTTQAEIVIDNDVILDGGGNLTVSARTEDPSIDAHRVFRVEGGITAELIGATVTGGDCVWPTDTSKTGMGIQNAGTLRITRSSVTGNGRGHDPSEVGIPCSVGGVENSGALTLTDSSVSNNAALYVGGIGNSGTMTVIRSDVSGNSAFQAAGIGNSGTLTLIDSAISGNRVTTGRHTCGDGDIIHSSGTMLLINSTVSNNGICPEYASIISSDGPTTLINSTVSTDFISYTSSVIEQRGGVLNLINCTVTGLLNLLAGPGEIRVTNTVFAGSNEFWDYTCGFAYATSGGGNLESPGDTCGFDQPTDQVNVSADDLKLGPLQDNGGPTETHALLPGSVAIDHIPPEACLDAEGALLMTDQRGLPRPAAIVGPEPMCDVGAFEVQP